MPKDLNIDPRDRALREKMRRLLREEESSSGDRITPNHPLSEDDVQPPKSETSRSLGNSPLSIQTKRGWVTIHFGDRTPEDLASSKPPSSSRKSNKRAKK